MAKSNKKILNEENDSESDQDSIGDEELSDQEEIDEEMEQNDSDEEADSDIDNAQAGPSKARTSSETSVDGQPAKKKKRGIIYISSIPKYMNVAILRGMIGQYAKINRVFLQPGAAPGTYCIC